MCTRPLNRDWPCNGRRQCEQNTWWKKINIVLFHPKSQSQGRGPTCVCWRFHGHLFIRQLCSRYIRQENPSLSHPSQQSSRHKLYADYPNVFYTAATKMSRPRHPHDTVVIIIIINLITEKHMKHIKVSIRVFRHALRASTSMSGRELPRRCLAQSMSNVNQSIQVHSSSIHSCTVHSVKWHHVTGKKILFSRNNTVAF